MEYLYNQQLDLGRDGRASLECENRSSSDDVSMTEAVRSDETGPRKGGCALIDTCRMTQVART